MNIWTLKKIHIGDCIYIFDALIDENLSILKARRGHLMTEYKRGYKDLLRKKRRMTGEELRDAMNTHNTRKALMEARGE